MFNINWVRHFPVLKYKFVFPKQNEYEYAKQYSDILSFMFCTEGLINLMP